jgi:hypothetical protein
MVPDTTATLDQTTGLSVTLNWTKPDENGGIITKYTIYMKDVAHESVWTKIDDVIDSSRLEYTISKNIEYGRTYKFIVTAWNECGETVKDDKKAKTISPIYKPTVVTITTTSGK